MILADKILYLRKQHAWSQEDLAEKMEVSRQSVSKWESGRSIPDMNKILLLSEIFSVSTDYLMKDHLESDQGHDLIGEERRRMVGLDQSLTYCQDKYRSAKLTARGVFIIINSILPLFIFLALADLGAFGLSEEVASGLGLVTMFLLLVVGVLSLIKMAYGDRDQVEIEREDFELEYGVEGILKERLKAYRPLYLRVTLVAVSLFLTCPLPLIIAAVLNATTSIVYGMVIILLLMVSLGVYMLVPASAYYSGLNRLLNEGEFSPYIIKETSHNKRVASIFWPCLTALYLGWSLWTMDWGRTWIVWPVGAVLFVALISMTKTKD